MRVVRWSPEKDGTLSEETLRLKLERLGYAVDRFVYPPGTSFPTHAHHTDKMDAVLSGQFQITMAGESVVLGPGDAVHVPRGIPHAARVVGDDAVVSLDAVRLP
jgi:quercetin dioxygenase-like cupin family protein